MRLKLFSYLLLCVAFCSMMVASVSGATIVLPDICYNAEQLNPAKDYFGGYDGNTSGVTLASGTVNNGFDFEQLDGGDVFYIPDNLTEAFDGDQSFSLMLEFIPESFSATAYIFDFIWNSKQQLQLTGTGEAIWWINDGGWDDVRASGLVAGNTYHFLLMYNHTSDVAQIYVNNTQEELLGGFTDIVVAGTRTPSLGGVGAYIDGVLDNFRVFYDVNLDAGNRTLYYNNGNMRDCDYDGSEAGTSVLSVDFWNESDYNKTVFDEEEEFKTVINHTYSNGTIVYGDVCNVTMFDGVSEHAATNDNFSLCASASCDVNTEYSESFNNSEINLKGYTGQFDYVEFEACHINNPVGGVTVEISCINGVDTETFSAAQLPICPITSSIRMESTTCSSNETVTVNVSSSAALPNRKLINNLEFEREFDELIINAGFNSPVYNTSFYHYFKHGTKVINTNCTAPNPTFSDSSRDTISIANIPPIVSHTGILLGTNFTSLTTNNTNVEFEAETFQFLIDVEDDDLTEANHTLRCVNGTVIFNIVNNASASIYVDYLDMVDFDCNPYDLTTSAIDDTNNATVLTTHFNLVDSVNPTCVGLTSASTSFNESYNISAVCFDEFFYSMNQTCTNRPNFLQTGINAQAYNHTFEFVVNETITCDYEYCDGHTNAKLKDKWVVRINSNQDEFIFRKGHLKEHKLKLFAEKHLLDYTILDDRITFRITDNNNRPEGTPKFYTMTYQASEMSEYIPSDKYKGWIVDYDSKTWFDLNGVNSDVDVFYLGRGLWELSFITTQTDINFQSIGELNCISGSYTLTPSAATSSPTLANWFGNVIGDGTCKMNDTKDILILVFVFGLLLSLFIINQLYIKLPIVDLIIGFTMLVYAIGLYPCGVLITLSIGFISLIFILLGVFDR